tara:strand:+ start:2451 stop:3158 length:708 start_codon:yes stop_codon:yes gene_type:complete
MPKKLNFQINENYIHRVEVYEDGSEVHNPKYPLDFFVDSEEASKTYQLEVYEYAAKLLLDNKKLRVLDIGCGTGTKTLNYFREQITVGLEIEPTLSRLRDTYPEENWFESNFEVIPEGHFSLVICADVIEHIINPNLLLDFIEKIDFQYCVISTPDRSTLRDRIRGIWFPKSRKKTPWSHKIWDKNSGPPRNTSHVREWTFDEFHSYIGERFIISEHLLCKEPDYFSQLVCIHRT